MSRANELFETELSHGTEHRVDVAMVPGAVLDDFEGVFERNELLPLEYASDSIDLLARQFGQVGKCALARFLALGIPIGLAIFVLADLSSANPAQRLPPPWYYIHHHSGFVRLEVETSDPQALQSDELVD